MQKKYSEIKPGDVFTFGGKNWIKLEEAGLCIMEDILEERVFDEESNDWRTSELREYLNCYFYKKLLAYGAEEKDFLMIETNLIADDGMKEYNISKDAISLMTADLYRSNRHLLKPLENWWWLATPHSCLVSNSHYVRCVNVSSTLGGNSVYNGDCGVRPLCNLSSETLVLVSREDTIEMSTTESIKKWAKERGLDKADTKAQMVKLLEVLGALANGINKGRQEQIINSIGNIYVVLTILSMQLGLSIEDCIDLACIESKD